MVPSPVKWSLIWFESGPDYFFTSKINKMNIPTAEDLLANNIDGLKDFIDDDDIFFFYKGVICEFAKEFAAMHVEAALKEASENVDMDKEYYESLQEGTNGGIDTETILSAYPFENIK
jgi:hypothetical protein